MKEKDLFKKEIDYYKSIDTLPVVLWFKINESNDLRYLLKEVHEVSKEQAIELEKAWFEIFFEFINVFGLPEKMRETLELKRDLMVLKIKFMLSEDRSLTTFIDIKERELAKISEVQKGEDHSIASAYVEKYMGFKLPKETTVKEFYSYVHIMKKEIAQQSKKTSNVD